MIAVFQGLISKYHLPAVTRTLPPTNCACTNRNTEGEQQYQVQKLLPASKHGEARTCCCPCGCSHHSYAFKLQTALGDQRQNFPETVRALARNLLTSDLDLRGSYT